MSEKANIYKELTFDADLLNEKYSSVAKFKKISNNKYAIENPPSGMFYTKFISQGYVDGRHYVNLKTDIVISIK